MGDGTGWQWCFWQRGKGIQRREVSKTYYCNSCHLPGVPHCIYTLDVRKHWIRAVRVWLLLLLLLLMVEMGDAERRHSAYRSRSSSLIGKERNEANSKTQHSSTMAFNPIRTPNSHLHPSGTETPVATPLPPAISLGGAVQVFSDHLMNLILFAGGTCRNEWNQIHPKDPAVSSIIMFGAFPAKFSISKPLPTSKCVKGWNSALSTSSVVPSLSVLPFGAPLANAEMALRPVKMVWRDQGVHPHFLVLPRNSYGQPMTTT